jgi:MFS family permease
MTDPHLPMPLARRAALILAVSSALAGSAGPISIGTSGLIALTMLPADQAALATVPVTAFVVGSALASVPAALFMRRVGRRTGFITGLLCGAVGAVIAALAIMAASFVLFTLSQVLIGGAAAFVQQYRFAAADAAEPSFKPRAISWVMAAGVISGVLGPQIAINAGLVVPIGSSAASFVILAALMVVAALVMTRLVVPAPPPIVAGQGGRPMLEIARQPKFLIALLSAIASYALMSFVMTAAPIAMVGHHHHTVADSQIAITWHVVAMFLPSFITGSLITRFGAGRIAATGFVLIGLGALASFTGTGIPQFWANLILLGVGWNFGFIASTAMLTTLYRPEEAFKVQAVNEFVLFGFVALASFGSGGLLASTGWMVINIIVLPVVAVALALLAWRGIADRRTA